MKSLFENSYFMLVVRLFLGFVFIAASVDKISDPNAFAVSIGYYKIVSHNNALFIATILPWMELLCGVLLLSGIMPRGSSLLTLLMLVIFIAGIVSGIARRLDIACGCFTSDPNLGKIGWGRVLENCGLIALSIIVYFSNSNTFSINALNGKQADTTSNDTKNSLP